MGGVPGHCPGVRRSPGARNRERDRGSRQTGSTDEGTGLERYMRQGEVYAGSARNDTQGRQSFESPQGLPHFPLTLFPVVVSALVSAPRRSNTDVLWRPGREVRSLANAWGVAPAGLRPAEHQADGQESSRPAQTPGSSGPSRHTLDRVRFYVYVVR